MGCCSSKRTYICTLDNITLDEFLNRCEKLDIEVLRVNFNKVKLVATKSDINILKRFCYTVYELSHRYHHV